MRAKDALVEAFPARQLELFGEAPAESERARAEPAVANGRRRRSTPDLEVLQSEPSKPSTLPDATRSAVGRAARARPSTGGQRTLQRLSVSPDEAAAILGVSRDFLDEHVIDELRVVRRGRRILIALTELERWLDRSATRATLGRA